MKFPDHLLSPSDTTEKPMEIGDNTLPEHPEVESHITDNSLPQQPQIESTIIDNALPKQSQVETCSVTEFSSQNGDRKKAEILKVDNEQPSTSTQDLGQTNMTSFSISPREVRPPTVQKTPRYVKKPNKRRRKTVILVSSPHKLELELEEQETLKNQKRNF